MKNIQVLILGLVCVLLSACGGSSNSGSDSSREPVECVEFSNGNVTNTCNFAIVVRTFGGTSTPVTVPANSTVVDPDGDVNSSWGACEAPFTPVEATATTFNCV